MPQDVTLAASIIVALALLAPLFLVTRPSLPLDLGPGAIGAILYIAIFASLIAFLLWSYGVSELGAARAGQFIYLMPVFSPVLAVLILGNVIGLPQLVGAVCVLAVIVLVNLTTRAATSRSKNVRAS